MSLMTTLLLKGASLGLIQCIQIESLYMTQESWGGYKGWFLEVMTSGLWWLSGLIAWWDCWLFDGWDGQRGYMEYLEWPYTWFQRSWDSLLDRYRSLVLTMWEFESMMFEVVAKGWVAIMNLCWFISFWFCIFD